MYVWRIKTVMSKTFDNLMKKMTTKYADTIYNGGNAKVIDRKITFTSPLLTYLFGEFTMGRIHNLFGPPSSGKSTLATYIAGQCQAAAPDEDHKKVAYIDFERSFDGEFATKLGLDMSNVYVIRAENIEDAFTIWEEMVRTGEICCTIFDSDATAPTRNELADEVNKASFGSGALALSRVLRRENILCSKYQTPLIEISQERANMNIMSHAIVTTGGTAAPYYASTRNRVKKIDSITDKNGVECGIVMEVRNYKNKTSIPWRKVNIRLLFDGGLDVDSEYEDFFYLLNILKTSGAWVYYEPLQLKWNGKAKVHEYFQSDEGKELYEKLKKEVMAKLTVSNELDKDNVKPSDEDTSAGDKAEAELEKQLEKEDSATN